MDITGLVLAFGSGIFGACIGALPAFILVGILVLLGAAVSVATGSADLLGSVAFGAWGPHVGGFACGVAACSYAAKKGIHDTGRNIAPAMAGVNAPDVLLVGGIFGIVGYVINWLFALPGGWTDTIALTVVASGILARIFFGKTGVFGKVADGESRFMPSEDKRWLPWQSEPLQVMMIGLGAGIFGAVIALKFPNGMIIGFGFSAASLVFLEFGIKVPVTHHITLPAAVAALASGSLVWGAIFGVVAALVGELFADVFNIWGDTHIDPPAGAIAIMTSVSIGLAAAGVYSAIPLP